MPFAPYYRIEGTGELEGFVQIVEQLSPESADHLCQVLPYCLHHTTVGTVRRERWMKSREIDKQGADIDVFPSFEPCMHHQACQRADRCVGLVKGYSAKKV